MDFHVGLMSLFVATLLAYVETLQLHLCLHTLFGFIATFMLDIPFDLLLRHNILVSRQSFSRCLHSFLHGCCNKVEIVVTMFLAIFLELCRDTPWKCRDIV